MRPSEFEKQARKHEVGFNYLEKCDQGAFENILSRIALRHLGSSPFGLTTSNSSQQLLTLLDDGTKLKKDKITAMKAYMSNKENQGKDLYKIISDILCRIESIFKYGQCADDVFKAIIAQIIACYDLSRNTKILGLFKSFIPTSRASEKLLTALRSNIPQQEKTMKMTEYMLRRENDEKSLSGVIHTVLHEFADLASPSEGQELKVLSTPKL